MIHLSEAIINDKPVDSNCKPRMIETSHMEKENQAGRRWRAPQNLTFTVSVLSGGKADSPVRSLILPVSGSPTLIV